VFNVQQVNSQQPPDWSPTREEIEQVKQAVKNEAYPPAGRSGVGPVARRAA
jgi:2-keto-3-deoxy-L-rhamnonate aldolase RhmA